MPRASSTSCPSRERPDRLVSGGDERLVEIAGELETIADQLGDIAMGVLREAISELSDPGGTDGGVPPTEIGAGRTAAARRERTINRARSAVLKAAGLAREAAGHDSRLG